MNAEDYKNNIINQWISKDLDVYEDECTPFNEMWNAFNYWFEENYCQKCINKMDIKYRLIEWQKNSQFNFTEKNGNERHPKFNLVPKPE